MKKLSRRNLIKGSLASIALTSAIDSFLRSYFFSSGNAMASSSGAADKFYVGLQFSSAAAVPRFPGLFWGLLVESHKLVFRFNETLTFELRAGGAGDPSVVPVGDDAVGARVEVTLEVGFSWAASCQELDRVGRQDEGRLAAALGAVVPVVMFARERDCL